MTSLASHFDSIVLTTRESWGVRSNGVSLAQFFTILIYRGWMQLCLNYTKKDSRDGNQVCLTVFLHWSSYCGHLNFSLVMTALKPKGLRLDREEEEPIGNSILLIFPETPIEFQWKNSKPLDGSRLQAPARRCTSPRRHWTLWTNTDAPQPWSLASTSLSWW